MADLAVKTKKMDFHLEQVQDFTPTPMTISTEAWYTGFHPYTLEPVFSAKSPKEKLAQRMFFFWYKPEERRKIETELKRIGRPDLITQLYADAYRPDYRNNGRPDNRQSGAAGYRKEKSWENREQARGGKRGGQAKQAKGNRNNPPMPNGRNKRQR